MNFALIGSEREWQQVRIWFAPQSEHRLVAVLPDPATSPWSDWPSATRRLEDFEELLADSSIDALILAGPISGRATRLRRIAQAGRACLCFQPADLAAIFYHEVALIAEETRAMLVPMMPGRCHPAGQKLLALCRSGSLGDLVTARIERMGPSPAGPELVAGIYAEAVGLLETLIGEIAEITATGDLASGRLVVHQRTAAGVTGEVRLVATSPETGREPVAPDTPATPVASSWSEVAGASAPSPVSERWAVSVEAERGRVELVWPVSLLGSARLRSSGARGSHEVEVEIAEPNQGLLAELARAVARQPHTPTWPDAIRTAELAECAFDSLHRRRSVEVHGGKRDELASFKGTMASCGCGLIWLTLVVLIVVAAGKGLDIPGMDWLASSLAAIWIVFLALQALRWVLPAETGTQRGTPDQRHPPFRQSGPS